MAENHNVIVELGSVIQDRGEWNDLASNAKLYMNNIVQYGRNAYRVKAVPVAGYLTKDVLPTNTTYYTLFAGVGELATDEDFTNPDATKRAKIPTVGAVLDGLNDGVYDVTARNNGATFESLEALLSDANLNTLIPASWRKGGMSVKFIQGSVSSSDNKYVQYRLMTTSWSTNVSDWQGVDDIPTAGSRNLVKSGGVYNKLSELGSKTYNIEIEIKDSDNEEIVVTNDNETIEYLRITDEKTFATDFENKEGVSLSKLNERTSEIENVRSTESGEEILITDNNEAEVLVCVNEDGLSAKEIKTNNGIKLSDMSEIKKENILKHPDEILVTSDSDDNVLLRLTEKSFYTKHPIKEDGTPIALDPYYNNSQFIPDLSSRNLGRTIIYEGDTKSNNNYIVNAVSYPNGEIIAARRGGSIVKINLDGTETTLLSISGASDWRCMFMDSNLNVYASPHASIDGGNMATSDRGLYKLSYGGNTMQKVISLYDPTSSTPSETQENHDTIWNMCEDRSGYLYAGVYAHSIPLNPAIYRSTDGGDTWDYIFNFITSGVCPTGKHIHTIIYNEYDNNLYTIVGEYNEIFKSTTQGTSWEPMGVQLEYSKGSAMIAVKDGLIVGSDSAYACLMSKVYTDGSHKTTGRMWANIVFEIRKSDITGYLYAFTLIDWSVWSTDYMPPVEALTDETALNDWILSNPPHLTEWQDYHNNSKDYYPEDCIRPQHCAIIVSKDNGETWEILYKEYVTSDNPYGFITTGYFRNGECVTGRTRPVNDTIKFVRPLVITEGKQKYTENGIDVSNQIFAKTLNNKIINNL